MGKGGGGRGGAIPPEAGAALYMGIGSSSVPSLRLPSMAVAEVVGGKGDGMESEGRGGDTEDATDVAADLGLIVSSSPSVDPDLRRRRLLVADKVAFAAVAVVALAAGFNLLRISGAPSRKACEVFSCAR